MRAEDCLRFGVNPGDSKLRGCDVVSLKVEDIALHGYTVERATVRQ